MQVSTEVREGKWAYDYRFLLRTQGSGGHVCAGAYIGKKGKVGE